MTLKRTENSVSAKYYLRYSGNRTVCASVEKQCQTDFTGKIWGMSKRDSRDKGIHGVFASRRRLTNQGPVSIRKTVFPGMGIPMLKIRRPVGRLIFNMGIAIPSKTVFLIETAPWSPSNFPNRTVLLHND